MARERVPLRDRYNSFVARHEVAWELGMGALAIAFVAVGFLVDDAEPPARGYLDAAEIALTVVFVVEFVSRFAAAHDRVRYLRGHWIDLVALIPVARVGRLARLIRLLRLVRAFAGLYRFLARFERVARHRGLVALVVAWLAVAVFSSIALYAVESGVNENIATPIDALWWGVVTLTTVGYGDVFPVTPEGRLVASVLMLLGITMFGAITATITSALIAVHEQPTGPDAAAQLVKLADLRDRGIVTSDEFNDKKAELLARM